MQEEPNNSKKSIELGALRYGNTEDGAFYVENAYADPAEERAVAMTLLDALNKYFNTYGV